MLSQVSKGDYRRFLTPIYFKTHWGRVKHIYVSRLTITGSDNGLSPGRRQAIIWTNAGILLIGTLGTNFSENLIEILAFSFTKMRLKVSSAKWRPFCLGLNVLNKERDLPLLRHFIRSLSSAMGYLQGPPGIPWQWRHNGHDGVSNHQPDHCLLHRLFRHRSKKKIKAPRHWPLWWEFTGVRWIPRTNGQ